MELKRELERPVFQIARVNTFASAQSVRQRAADRERVNFAGYEAVLCDVHEGLRPSPDEKGLADFYLMDAASIFAAAALEVQGGDEVLDLCASPGGKTLILAENLRYGGRLVANEMSDRRRARLRAVLEDYLPPEMLARVSVTGHDGTRWCLHQTEAFDRILVDAPCSGERHLLADPSEMKLWSQARSRNLAVRQYALLASALAVVRIGGRIVYSTCSISPLENDAVIARLLKKRAGEVRVVPAKFELGEPTEQGWFLLPDRTRFGPIYLSILERI
jgi:16S rRNA C967 or C1407 C5-methylase (RsmB/RsmF family)